MEKELALAVEFGKAPKELQDLAKKHWGNTKAVGKLKKKLTEIAVELEQAEKSFEESAKALRIALKTWEPEL